MVEQYTSSDMNNITNDPRFTTSQGMGRVWAENAPLVMVSPLSGLLSSGSGGSGSTVNFSIPSSGDPTGGNQVIAIKTGAVSGTGVYAYLNVILDGERLGLVLREDSDPCTFWVDGETFKMDVTEIVSKASLMNVTVNSSQGIWCICKDRNGRDMIFDKRPKICRVEVASNASATKQANLFGFLVSADSGRRMIAPHTDCNSPGQVPSSATAINISTQKSIASLIYYNTDSVTRTVTLYQSNGTTIIGTIVLGAAGSTTAPLDTAKFDLGVGNTSGANAKLFHKASAANVVNYATVGVGGQV